MTLCTWPSYLHTWWHLEFPQTLHKSLIKPSKALWSASRELLVAPNVVAVNSSRTLWHACDQYRVSSKCLVKPRVPPNTSQIKALKECLVKCLGRTPGDTKPTHLVTSHYVSTSHDGRSSTTYKVHAAPSKKCMHAAELTDLTHHHTVDCHPEFPQTLHYAYNNSGPMMHTNMQTFPWNVCSNWSGLRRTPGDNQPIR